MMIVETANSIYEFDTNAKLVRRIGGGNEPTDRFREDGEWRPYTHVTFPAHGESMIITRDHTITSAVQSARADRPATVFINSDGSVPAYFYAPDESVVDRF